LASYFECGEKERRGHLCRRVYLRLSGRGCDPEWNEYIYVGKFVKQFFFLYMCREMAGRVIKGYSDA